MDTLFVAVISSGVVGSVLVFVQFLINRHDERGDKNSEVLDAIKAVDEKVETLEKQIVDIEHKSDESEATMCRARILRFNKELIRKERHTLEEFGQCLDDCDKYEHYCEAHPKFKNNKATLSIENIKRCYAKCEKDGDFL